MCVCVGFSWVSFFLPLDNICNRSVRCWNKIANIYICGFKPLKEFTYLSWLNNNLEISFSLAGMTAKLRKIRPRWHEVDRLRGESGIYHLWNICCVLTHLSVSFTYSICFGFSLSGSALRSHRSGVMEEAALSCGECLMNAYTRLQLSQLWTKQ